LRAVFDRDFARDEPLAEAPDLPLADGLLDDAEGERVGFVELAFALTLGDDADVFLAPTEGCDPAEAEARPLPEEDGVLDEIWDLEDPLPLADGRPPAFFFAVGMSISVAESWGER
jgi:hypothetical protein